MNDIKSKLEELAPLLEKHTDELDKISDEIRMIEKFFTEKNFCNYIEIKVPIDFNLEKSRIDFILSWRKWVDGRDENFRLVYNSPDKGIEKPLIETNSQTRKYTYRYLPYFLDAVKTELTKGEKENG